MSRKFKKVTALFVAAFLLGAPGAVYASEKNNGENDTWSSLLSELLENAVKEELHPEEDDPSLDSDNAVLSIDGECGETVSWEWDQGGTLRIEGSGAMYDYQPDEESEMAMDAFWQDCGDITAIEIGEEVSYLGDYAFYGLVNVKRIRISSAQTTFGEHCLEGIEADLLYPDGEEWDEEKMQDYGGRPNWIPMDENHVIHEPANDGQLLNGPSYLTPGLVSYVCAICGEEYTEEIAIIGEGTTGLKAAWHLGIDGVLHIDGSGPVFAPEHYQWEDVKQEVHQVIVEEGITEIGARAFAGFLNLEEVKLPESLLGIQAEAFEKCSSLKALVIPAQVAKIGDQAFEDSGLCSIAYQGEAPEFGEQVYDGIVKLRSIYPAECASWTEEVFEQCGGRRTKWIDRSSLCGSCGESASWSFENGILTISGSGNMDDFQIHCDENTLELGYNSPWNDISSAVVKLVVEDGITSLGNMAFAQFEHMREVSLPEGLSSIGKNTFNGCNNLEEIVIPSSVTIFREYAFSNCSKLASITFSVSMEKIEDNVFKSCPNLANVNYSGNTEAWNKLSIGMNGNGNLLNARLHTDYSYTEALE